MVYTPGSGGRVEVVVPANVSVSVSIARASGGALTVYSDAARTASVAMPATATGTSTFYLADDDLYTLGATVSGVQCASFGGTVGAATLYIRGDTTLTLNTDRETAETAGANAAYASKFNQRHMPYPQDAFPPIMSSPPTLGTPRVGNPATQITSGVFVSAGIPAFPSTPTALNPMFTYRGGIPALVGSYYVQPNQGVGQAWTATLPYSIEGWHYGTQIDYGYKGQGSLPTRVWVDGQPAELPYTADATQDGSPHLRLITFASAAWRRIRIDFDSCAFWGLWIGPTDTWTAIPEPVNRLLVIGDSYGQSTGATAGFTGYPYALGRGLGYNDVWSYSLGSTGLLASSGVKPTYRGRAVDWAATNASGVMIQLSINDDSTATSLLVPELALLVTAIQTALPNAKDIWVQGCCARGGSDVANKQTRDTAMAVGCPVPFASLVNPPIGPLWTGTGGIETPSGTGNSDVVYHNGGSLASHPSQIGYDMIARAGAVSRIATMNAT